jgi:hypothetical protein
VRACVARAAAAAAEGTRHVAAPTHTHTHTLTGGRGRRAPADIIETYAQNILCDPGCVRASYSPPSPTRKKKPSTTKQSTPQTRPVAVWPPLRAAVDAIRSVPDSLSLSPLSSISFIPFDSIIQNVKFLSMIQISSIS